MRRKTQKKITDSEKPESDATDVAAAAKAEVKEEKSDFNKKKKKKRTFGIYKSANVLRLSEFVCLFKLNITVTFYKWPLDFSPGCN